MDSQLRSLTKTLTYRFAAFLACIPLVGVTGSLYVQLVLLVVYYLHERIWDRVNWQRQA